MDHPNLLKLPKWPFIAGDLALLAAACWIGQQSQGPLGHWEVGFVVLCVVAGALCGMAPFVLEYRMAAKRLEIGELTSAVAQIQRLDTLATQISGATAQWQAVHDEAGKTVSVARQISEGMTAELRGFTEFMDRANNSERTNLRLEVEKLRRAEADWLQVVVRMLDHVFALHQGAVRSGKPNLIEQMSRFQGACIDATRRVGLMPFIAAPAEPFDPKRHQLMEGVSQPAGEACVGDTVATGYTYQGRLLRPALVRLGGSAAEAAPADGPASGTAPTLEPAPAAQAEPDPVGE